MPAKDNVLMICVVGCKQVVLLRETAPFLRRSTHQTVQEVFNQAGK